MMIKLYIYLINMANIKSYPIKTDQNALKNNAIFDLYKEYKRYYKIILHKNYNHYLKTGRLDKFINVKEDKTPLSERYKRTISDQSIGQLQSWISNRNNTLTDRIHSCESLSDEQKHKLHLIKIYKIKTHTSIKSGKKSIEITKEDITLFKSINRSLKWLLPSAHNISMCLNNNVCLLVKKQSTKKKKAKKYDYWFELSTLKKGKKVLIPALTNKYFDKQLKEGKLLNATRIDIKKNKYISFNLMIDKEGFETGYVPEIDSIGIDFGIKNLFAISTGHIFGVNFGKQLAKMDSRINTLQKRLQSQNIKPNSSKRYRRMVFKCKEFIENEINRNFNKIIEEIKPKEIVLERLDFRNSKLSKSMNRILRKCGRSVVKGKLTALQKKYNITITEVNPAYSSQECNKCGFVHKLNRYKRDSVKCKNCNHKQHADINASRNIRNRSSIPVLRGKSGKKTIKRFLFEGFAQKHKSLQCSAIGRNINYICPNRRAVFLECNPLTFDEFWRTIKPRKKTGIKAT
jgi:putative transposase